MSSPLAIAAVTAALKDLLNDGLMNHDLSAVGSFSVTALPPDRITTGQNEPNQLNLFLYQVTPNLGWRNVGLPSRDEKGVRLSAAPLALDLHYLLTAYGAQDLNAEILLGYGMQLLHETPVLSRAQLRTVLAATSPVTGAILPGPFGTLSAIDLADQIELVKITPVFLSTEDLSKMWTAMQARYRPTMAYMASVVLIQVTNGGKVVAPVLKRGKDDRGPIAMAAGFPTLTSVRPEVSDLLPAMRLGDDLLIAGSNLADPSSITALLENVKAKVLQRITPSGVASPTEIRVHLPSVTDNPQAMSDWAVGLYSVSLRVARPDLPVWTTNTIPIALAPLVTITPRNFAVGNITLTVECTPRLRPEQGAQTRLIFGSRSVSPGSITTPADPLQPSTLTFSVPAVKKGEYLVRLRVEGIDSIPVTIADSGAKLDFDPNQKVTVA